MATKTTEFGEITQTNGHYAFQGHSRSPILLHIESPYALFYWWLILTYLLSCTVSKLRPIIRQIFTSDRGCFTLTPSLGWSPSNIRTNFTFPETGMIVLPDAVNRTIVSLFVWTKHRNVTDGQTDRIALDNTAVCVASSADAL